MSIQTELSRIINAKAAIKAAIEGKGVTVPDGTLLDGMAALIESIEAGGGGMTVIQGTFTCAENTMSYEVVHNLGKIPKIWCYMLATNKLNGITNEGNPTYRFVIGCSFWESGQVFIITKVGSGFTAYRIPSMIFDSNTSLTSINETSITFGSTSMNAKYSAFKANTEYMWFVAG